LIRSQMLYTVELRGLKTVANIDTFLIGATQTLFFLLIYLNNKYLLDYQLFK